MGFTAAGADHFYASGHPGPSDDLPNPVGLIESTDAGETWQPLSPTGESDFHTLGAAGNQVYGFNGQLIGTDDGRNWTPGAQVVDRAHHLVARHLHLPVPDGRHSRRIHRSSMAAIPRRRRAAIIAASCSSV